MGEQNIPIPPMGGVFEKRWVKNTIIGVVIFIAVIVALRTVMGTLNMATKSSSSSFSLGSDDISAGLSNESSAWNMPKIGGTMANKSLSANDIVRESTAPMGSNGAAGSVTDKKVIKNGNLNLKVNSVDNAVKDVAGIAMANGGDVFSSNVYNRNSIKNGNIVVKVPVANFEKTFNEIKKVASLVIQESTTGQDVTEEYADLQSQLKNRQAEEAQFQLILQQAQKIQDVLDVTQQLYRVRGEIEQLQGRMKYLDSQTDMSSISIALSEDQNITVTDSWRPWQVAKDAVNSLIKKAQGFVNFAIVLVVTVIPTAILYLIFVYIIFLIGRKIYRKMKGDR